MLELGQIEAIRNTRPQTVQDHLILYLLDELEKCQKDKRLAKWNKLVNRIIMARNDTVLDYKRVIYDDILREIDNIEKE